MQVIVQIKNVYGKEMIYPIGERAEIFAAIAGTKTLTRATLRLIKQLGAEIIVQQPDLTI